MGVEADPKVMDVNLSSLFILCQAAGKHMIPLRRGKIINVASLNSYFGGQRTASYTASKAAVVGLTRCLSNEWAKFNINVNAIAPGSVATDMCVAFFRNLSQQHLTTSNTEARKNPDFVNGRLFGTPGQRWGTPEDFAGPAVFLASAASQFITGETLTVDGVSVALSRRKGERNGMLTIRAQLRKDLCDWACMLHFHHVEIIGLFVLPYECDHMIKPCLMPFISLQQAHQPFNCVFDLPSARNLRGVTVINILFRLNCVKFPYNQICASPSECLSTCKC